MTVAAAVLALTLVAGMSPPAGDPAGSDPHRTAATASAVTSAPAAVAAGSFAETTLWNSTDADQYANFHVHGLAVVPAGTPVPASGGRDELATDVVLAFTEGRFEVADAGAKDLLVRRSTDGGRTWSGSVPVIPANPAHSWGNPSPLVDTQTGAVFLFHKGSGGSIFVTRSDDAGASWGPMVPLTHLFANNPYGWTLNGPTTGHGIQLDNGRLLMPVIHRAPDPPGPRWYGVDTVYSDDHGVTWRRGARVPVSEAYPFNESRVFQRADGAVVLTGRWPWGGTRYRMTATSTDGGNTWADPVIDGATGEFVSVDAGLVRYSRGPVNRILFSRPNSSARQNMTVSVSYDEGASYRYSRVVNAGPSYYSDLAVLSDGTILLLYGRDGTQPSFPERVAAARFDLEWLTSGRDSRAGGPGLTQHEYELASPAARAVGGTPPTIAADANARGGRSLRYGARTAGDYVEVPFEVPAAGSYELAVRHHRLSDRGRIRTSVDGVELPYGTVDPTFSVGAAYQVYPLGRVTLAAGAHWIRFTLAAAGRSGGTTIAPDQLLLVSGPATPDAPTLVADNDSAASFSQVSQVWSRGTGVAGYYGQSYHSRPAGNGSGVARWRPDVPMSGLYEVAVRWTAHENRASNAPYVVNHADGRAAARLDQRTRGGQWVSLGTYPFVAGGTGTVELSDAANGHVVADAVRLTRQEGAVVDDDTAGFAQVSGVWSRATGVAGFYGQSYHSRPAGNGSAVARWRPDVPVSGRYQVAVWYAAHENRASNAPYAVEHADGRATVRVDQRSRGGQWVVLGTFPFDAGRAGAVELSDAADGFVIADAVRLLYQANR